MAEVAWSDEASGQLEQIIAYIEAFDPKATHSIGERLDALGQSLAHFPNRGRPAGPFRELATVPPFILRYAVDGDDVTIISIRHGRRRTVNP